MTHASDIQERMFNLMMEIDDTKPFPPKLGRLNVAVNVLAQEIVSVGVDEITDADDSDGWEPSADVAVKWAQTAISMLIDACIELGHPDWQAEFKLKFLETSVKLTKKKESTIN